MYCIYHKTHRKAKHCSLCFLDWLKDAGLGVNQRTTTLEPAEGAACSTMKRKECARWGGACSGRRGLVLRSVAYEGLWRSVHGKLLAAYPECSRECESEQERHRIWRLLQITPNHSGWGWGGGEIRVSTIIWVRDDGRDRRGEWRWRHLDKFGKGAFV